MHVLYVSISLLLQQDNARPHLARATTQYLSQANVNIMDDWPALSVDLNPVEHCSDYLKNQKAPTGNVRDFHVCHPKRVANTPTGFYPTSGEVYEA